MIVCLPAFWRLQYRPFGFCLGHVGREDRGDRPRYLVLNREHILHVTIVTLRPQMVAAFRIDELGRDAYALAGAPHAAFKQVANAEIAPNLGRKNGRLWQRTTRRTADG